MAQMATNVYKPKMASKLQINTSYNNSYLPAVQWPKWQQICTSPNGPKCTSPNGNKYVQAQIACT